MQRIPRILTVLLLVPALLPALVPAAEPETGFFFKDGDRVLFLGDSITDQHQYSNTIELYLTTRFPKWNLTFLNAGIGGDTAGGGNGRFASQVLAEKPTAVTINFGMNDGGYGVFNAKSAENFLKNTEAMLMEAGDAKVRVALVSPNAVDWRKQAGRKLYLETQKQFYAGLKDLAAKHSLPFADQYATTRAALEKMETDKADKANPFPDTVHTSPMGGLLMAHAILTGLKTPALVSSVEIKVSPGQDDKAVTKGCKVENLKVTKEQVSFERTDQALPMPIPKEWAPILPYVNEMRDLNDYRLKVSGLEAGKYTLSIDGKEVARYSSEDLDKGVNLGLLTEGPIYDQGKKVFDAINQKNGLVKDRFNNVVRFTPPAWLATVVNEIKPQELEKRMKVISEKQEAIYKMVQPTPHRFELKRAA